MSTDTSREQDIPDYVNGIARPHAGCCACLLAVERMFDKALSSSSRSYSDFGFFKDFIKFEELKAGY